MSSHLRLQQSAAWDERSASYEDLAEPFTLRFGLALADELVIAPGERVLDVAAGTGGLTLAMAGRGAHVTAVDHSPAMAARIETRAALEGVADRVQAVTMDGQALAFDEPGFDVGLSVFGIMLFPDHEAGLRELVRAVRSGGRAGLAVWRGFGAGPALLLHQSFTALFPEREVPAMPAGLLAWSDPDPLRQSMEHAGLVEVQVCAMDEDWEFPSAESIRKDGDRWFEMLPIWSTLDEAERRRVTEDMVARLSMLPRPAVPSPALLAVGRKPGPA